MIKKTEIVFRGLMLIVLTLILAVLARPVTMVKQLGGTAGNLAISTSTTVTFVIGSTTPVQIATSTPNCASRIIKTAARDIFFTIGSSTVSAPVVNGAGILQLSSTTVVYPAENYGCALWQAVSYETSSSNASTTITITETK